MQAQSCHLCGGERQLNWYFYMCETHKSEHRAKNRRSRDLLRCENGNHDWQTGFHGGIEKKTCIRCQKTKLPAYLSTAVDNKVNSYTLYKKMEKLTKKFPRKYRRFEEYYYTGRVANLVYWLRYEKGWSATKIEETFKIDEVVLDALIMSFTWRKGDAFLGEKIST